VEDEDEIDTDVDDVSDVDGIEEARDIGSSTMENDQTSIFEEQSTQQIEDEDDDDIYVDSESETDDQEEEEDETFLRMDNQYDDEYDEDED
jgi:hypothetical protein